MNKKSAFVVTALLTILLLGCVQPAVREAISLRTPQQLENTSWRLVKYQVGNQALQFDSGAAYHSAGALNFGNDGKFTGSDGCNGLKGELHAGEIQSMRMSISFVTAVMCRTASIELENGGMATYDIVPNDEDVWFRNALNSVYRYELADNSLRLYFTNRAFRPFSPSRLLSLPRPPSDSSSYYMEFVNQALSATSQSEASGKEWQAVPALRECEPTQVLKRAVEQDC